MQVTVVKRLANARFWCRDGRHLASARQGSVAPVHKMTGVPKPLVLLGFLMPNREANSATKKMWVMTRIEIHGYRPSSRCFDATRQRSLRDHQFRASQRIYTPKKVIHMDSQCPTPSGRIGGIMNDKCYGLCRCQSKTPNWNREIHEIRERKTVRIFASFSCFAVNNPFPLGHWHRIRVFRQLHSTPRAG